MLKISNLSVQINENKILNEMSFVANPGEVHAIMGPNGSGKSTFAKIVAGDPNYDIISGVIQYNGEDLLSLEPEERVHRGIFLGYQYPVEVPGVSNSSFLRMAYNAKQKFLGKEEVDPMEFGEMVKERAKNIGLPLKDLDRPLNQGFSGGEKKRNEMLQMAILDPACAILDETDSGLDIDSLKIIASSINKMRSSQRIIILITHYQRLLDYIVPDFVHVFKDGAIIKTGDASLAKELEKTGYEEQASAQTSP